MSPVLCTEFYVVFATNSTQLCTGPKEGLSKSQEVVYTSKLPPQYEPLAELKPIAVFQNPCPYLRGENFSSAGRLPY